MSDTARTVVSIFLALCIAPFASDLKASGPECGRTAKMRIYSSTFVDKQTGDLDGYELAIKEKQDSRIDAWLYVYEGAPNDEGIHISGTISAKQLAMEGNWAEHLIEYPSKKEIVQNHFVKMDGSLDSTWFRGTLKIEGLFTPSSVRLKRVHSIWMCKN